MQPQTPSNKFSIKECLQLGIFTLFCFIAFTYNLSEVPPYHADENFYVTTSRNMVESGDYITPVYHDKKRFAKPILFYWLVATSYKTFGINLYSARLVSAIFGTLCIPLVYIIARRIFDKQTAIISAVLLPGCYLHSQIARWAITDMTLNFFILSAIYFFISGLYNTSSKGTPYYLAYICMGIGFMIKGPLAIIIPTFVIGVFILTAYDWKRFYQLRLGYGIVILTAIIFPWFYKMLALHGDEFKNHILGAELRDRVIHNSPFSFYYFWVTIRYNLPWSLFFISALIIKFKIISTSLENKIFKRDVFSSFTKKLKTLYIEMIRKDNQAFLLTILWVVVPLILFTLFRIEHSRYMLVATPAIAMIVAHFFSQLLISPDKFRHKSFKIPFYLTIIFYTLLLGLIGIGTFILHPIYSAPFGLITLYILILVGLTLLLLLYKCSKYFPMIIVMSVIQITTLTLVNGNILSFFNRYPMKLFANKIISDSHTEKRIGLYQLGNHRARMGVMTGLPSIYLNNLEELKSFIRPGGIAYVVMRKGDWKDDFRNLPMAIQATDTGWMNSRANKDVIRSFLNNLPISSLSKYSEVYILLKKK
ncbi:MAG TPA: glycosyltransferase family 39 protein [Nitrospinaceae bacterium]|nr:glycosyltransferase family 39 protein [Nitrospinaceae bacterium]